MFPIVKDASSYSIKRTNPCGSGTTVVNADQIRSWNYTSDLPPGYWIDGEMMLTITTGIYSQDGGATDATLARDIGKATADVPVQGQVEVEALI